MISDNDRSYWFGASDSQKVIATNHNTETWRKWWRVKCGIEESDFVGNIYTDAGQKFEHPILDAFDKGINKDRQLFIDDMRLRVNYDGDKNGYIYEVKTHKADKPFEISPYIEAQVQTEMYVYQECLDDFKGLYILSYGLTESDYYCDEPIVDFDRIKVHKVKYRPKAIKKFLKCLKPLVEELDEMSRKPSIMQDEKKCFFTGSTEELDCHHIYHGYGNRKVSDENGFWVWLRHDYHIADSTNETPHNNIETDLYLKRECQKKFEETHSREEFMELIGRNYLD